MEKVILSSGQLALPNRLCNAIYFQSGLERTPIEMRRRLWNTKYQGDPDLKPIQSFEVAFLVRMLYHVASWINVAVSIIFEYLFKP